MHIDSNAQGDSSIQHHDMAGEVTQAAPGLGSIKALLASINDLAAEHTRLAHWHFTREHHEHR